MYARACASSSILKKACKYKTRNEYNIIMAIETSWLRENKNIGREDKKKEMKNRCKE